MMLITITVLQHIKPPLEPFKNHRFGNTVDNYYATFLELSDPMESPVKAYSYANHIFIYKEVIKPTPNTISYQAIG